MALDSEIRSKIMRQEMDAALVGPSFTQYEGRVKYNPENIEKDDFFSLCYGMLKVGDEVKLHTYKKDKFDVYYRFLITAVDKEEKKVTSMLLNKFDFMNPETNVEVEGVDTEALNKAVQVMVEAKTKDLVKEELQAAPVAPIVAPDGSTVETEGTEDESDENEDEEGEE